MAPSTHEAPIDKVRTPNPDRLWLYEAVGSAVQTAVFNVPSALKHTDPEAYTLAIGASVVRQLAARNCLIYKDGEVINLSRYDDHADPPHTWSR